MRIRLKLKSSKTDTHYFLLKTFVYLFSAEKPVTEKLQNKRTGMENK